MSDKLKNIALGWDEVEEASNGFSSVEVGAYVVRIDDIENFDDKEYLKIYFDINEGKLKNHFSEEHKRFGPAWPFNATVYASYKQTALSFFKRFITAVERSNAGYNFVKTGGDFEKLKGKLLVAVFGLTEIPVPDAKNENKPQVKVRFREWRSIEALKDGKIVIDDEVKKLSSDYDLKAYENALDEIGEKPAASVEKNEEQAYQTSKAIVGDDELPF